MLPHAGLQPTWKKHGPAEPTGKSKSKFHCGTSLTVLLRPVASMTPLRKDLEHLQQGCLYKAL